MDQSYRNKVIGGGICLAAIGLAGLAYLKRDALLSAFLSPKSLSAGVQVQPENLDRSDQTHVETSEVACGASQPSTVDTYTDPAVVARATVSVQTETVRQEPPTEEKPLSFTLVNRACGRDAPFVSDVSTSANQTTAATVEVQTPSEFIDALYKCESTENTTTEDNHPHQPLSEKKTPRCLTLADHNLEDSGKEQVDASDSQKTKLSISCEEFEEDDSGSLNTSESSEWCSSEETTLVQSISNERFVQTSQKGEHFANNEHQTQNYEISGHLTESGQGLQACEANGRLPTYSLKSECCSSEKNQNSLLCKFKPAVGDNSENATITFDTDSRPVVSEFIACGRSALFVTNENAFSKRVLTEIQQSLPQNDSKPCDKSTSLSYAPSGVAVQVEPGNVSDCESKRTTNSVSDYDSQLVRKSLIQNSVQMTHKLIYDCFSYIPSAAQKLLKPQRDESCTSEWTGSSLSEYASGSVNNSQPPWNSSTAISDKLITSETTQEAHELKEECAEVVGNDATTEASLSNSFSLESYGRVQTCTPTIASNYKLKSSDSETGCDDSSSLFFHEFQGYGGSSTTVEKTTIGTNHASYKTTVGVDPCISMPVDSTAMATDDITAYETDQDEVICSTSESFSLERNELDDQNSATVSAPIGCLSVSVDDLTSNRDGPRMNSPDCGDFASSRSYSKENDPERQTSPLDVNNIHTEEFADTSASIAVVKNLSKVQITSFKKVPNGLVDNSSRCGADNSNSFKSTEAASATNKSTSVSDY